MGTRDKSRCHVNLLDRRNFSVGGGLLRSEAAVGLISLHVNAAGLKSQAFVLKIMPSFKPSFSSHALMMASVTSLLSLSDSFGVIPFNVAAKYASPRFECPVRMAGSPATTPSKRDKATR